MSAVLKILCVSAVFQSVASLQPQAANVSHAVDVHQTPKLIAAQANDTAIWPFYYPGFLGNMKYDATSLSIFHTNMMCYYYFIILYINFASKVGAPIMGTESSLEKARPWSLEKDRKLGFMWPNFMAFNKKTKAMAKKFKADPPRHHAVSTQGAPRGASHHVPQLPRHDAPHRRMSAPKARPSHGFEVDEEFESFHKAKQFQSAHDYEENRADYEDQAFLEEPAELEESVNALKVVDGDMNLEKEAKFSTTVLTKWLDLCANYHIISGAFIGLYGAYASKDYMGIWQNSVKVVWQWALIWEDWLTIYSEQGGEVKHMDYVTKYRNSLFLSFSSLWAWNSWTGLYKAIATGFTTPAAVWSFASNLSGFRCAMDLNHIGWFEAIDLYSTTGTGVFSAGSDFILYSFSIDMLWNSVIAWYSSKSPAAAAAAVAKK